MRLEGGGRGGEMGGGWVREGGAFCRKKLEAPKALT